MAVSVAEVAQEELPIIEDGTPYPEHCSIDFTELSNGQINKKAKKLKSVAEARGWLYRNYRFRKQPNIQKKRQNMLGESLRPIPS